MALENSVNTILPSIPGFSVMCNRLTIQQAFCVSHVKNIFHNIHIIYKLEYKNTRDNYNEDQLITIYV